jgi:hypothetical protein
VREDVEDEAEQQVDERQAEGADDDQQPAIRPSTRVIAPRLFSRG